MAIRSSVGGGGTQNVPPPNAAANDIQIRRTDPPSAPSPSPPVPLLANQKTMLAEVLADLNARIQARDRARGGGTTQLRS